MEEKPSFLKAKGMDQYFNLARCCNLSPWERDLQRAEQKVRWDNEAVMAYAIEKAVGEAINEKAKQIAAKLKAEGFTVMQIAKFIDLSTEDIDQL